MIPHEVATLVESAFWVVGAWWCLDKILWALCGDDPYRPQEIPKKHWGVKRGA